MHGVPCVGVCASAVFVFELHQHACWQPQARVAECWGISKVAIASEGPQVAGALRLEFLMLYVYGVPQQTESLLRAA